MVSLRPLFWSAGARSRFSFLALPSRQLAAALAGSARHSPPLDPRQQSGFRQSGSKLPQSKSTYPTTSRQVTFSFNTPFYQMVTRSPGLHRIGHLQITCSALSFFLNSTTVANISNKGHKIPLFKSATEEKSMRPDCFSAFSFARVQGPLRNCKACSCFLRSAACHELRP